MKHRRTREIIIELTSLLDVVMILIFAVLLQNSELLEKKNQEIAGIEAENAGLLENISGLQEKLDSVSEDNDKLSEELQEALDKLDGDNLNEVFAKLDKYEDIADALKMLEGDAEIYYINTETVKKGSGDLDYVKMIITYGATNAEPEQISINYDDAQTLIEGKIYIIKRAVKNYIENIGITANSNKKFYIVLTFGEDYFTSVYRECVSNEKSLVKDLKETYKAYDNICIVNKY